MPRQATAPGFANLDNRLSRVEQILPTLATKENLRLSTEPLATKEELRRAIEPLATKEEMRAAIATAIEPLATRDEMKAFVRAEGIETRRRFDIVAESLRSDIRIIAEGQVHLTHRMGAFETETRQVIASLDRRVLRLESRRGRK
jgi:hypothetical protein